MDFRKLIARPASFPGAFMKAMLCARYTSPPLRQMRSPLYTNFFVSYCHPPF
jgi:hypothetical protein